MGVPFEALLPYGIIIGVRIIRQDFSELQLTTPKLFTVGATGLSYTKGFLNDGKKTRWNNDLWDRVSRTFSPRQCRNRCVGAAPHFLPNALANSSIAK